MTTKEKIEANRQAVQKYQKTEKGRKTIRKYRSSEKGKESDKKYQNTEKYKETKREYNQTEARKNVWLKSKYSFSIDEFNSLYERQNGKCAICQNSFISTPCIDHNHKTGKVRGLLCRPCNSFLGRIREEVKLLEKAKLYLRR